MKCTDCGGGLMSRAALRMRAVNLARAVADNKTWTPDQRAMFACHSLLMVAELGTRCAECANARLMEGASIIAARAEQSCEP